MVNGQPPRLAVCIFDKYWDIAALISGIIVGKSESGEYDSGMTWKSPIFFFILGFAILVAEQFFKWT